MANKESIVGKVGAVAVLVLLCIGFAVLFSSGDGQDKAKPTAEVSDWHRAESKEEVVRRITARLVGELAACGLDASNIVANAKAHPTRLRAGVPEHKRSRWLVLSTNDEAIIARRLVDEYDKQKRFDDKPDKIERVRAIMERLVAVVPEINAIPEIHIVRDDSVNACCLPNGTFFVNDGTLKTIADDSLLAAILAHELGHAAARHGNEDVTHALIGAAGGVAFEEWVAGIAPILDSGEGVSLVRLAYGLGGDLGFHLPRSRLQESEADRLGVRYLARARFDPEAMARVFLLFEQIAPQNPDIFTKLFSTHPLNEERVAHVREVLAEPDLREMPKENWRGKMKKKADELDFTKAPQVVSNVTSRLPKPPKPSEPATNAPSRFQKVPKMPWGRKDP